MRCAVLCNGPSRTSFHSREEYDFIIGCNIPWTEVDATVVLDEEVIRLWSKTPELITCPTYFSVKAWRETDALRCRGMFHPYLVELVHPQPKYHSSGHIAAEVCLRKEATKIDVYGCDSWFGNIMDTYTRQFVESPPNENLLSKSKSDGWRERWVNIVERNPNVSVQFIK
jgi:hypothetical protein